MGQILRDYDRSSYALATKVYFPMSARDRGLSRGQILKQIDASLERLQVDYVDLYQCHRYDDDVDLAETMGALTEVVEAGKARYIGFSEWPVERIREALELPGVAKFVSSQPQYSALWRGPEAELIPFASATGSRRSSGRRSRRACSPGSTSRASSRRRTRARRRRR